LVEEGTGCTKVNGPADAGRVAVERVRRLYRERLVPAGLCRNERVQRDRALDAMRQPGVELVVEADGDTIEQAEQQRLARERKPRRVDRVRLAQSSDVREVADLLVGTARFSGPLGRLRELDS
jgi:hypothetical protein